MNNLPTIKFVELDRLLLHEEVDSARIAKLKRIISRAEVFTNPPMVAPTAGGKKYIVLDGANRTTVFKQLGYQEIPVQIVRYGGTEVRLMTWNHLVTGLSGGRRLFSALRRATGAKVYATTLLKARRLLKRRAIVLYVVDGRTTWCIDAGRDFTRQIQALDKAVKVYKGRYKFFRVLGIDYKELRREYPEARPLFVFMPFREIDVIKAVRLGIYMPSGITRHAIEGRILRLDIPLEIVRSRRSITTKNRFLRKLLEQRLSHNQIRYYTEPIFIYND
ncbi:MAG: hypothetical protein HY974_02965 [Candidatus Kerfeldbacteria bacterium]|nr:hypothetical protein [Candidatus Kerfeldbacteria bacterium]